MRCNVVTSCRTACSSHYHTAVVFTHAFTTSQSAEAHVILFRRIFEIAMSDTGLPVMAVASNLLLQMGTEGKD